MRIGQNLCNTNHGERKLHRDAFITFLIAVMAFSIPFVMYWDELVAGNTIVSGDGLGLFYSFQYLQNLLGEGSFPLWNPYLAGGMPQGIMVGAPGLYPLNWVVALAPVGVQMYLYYAIHLALGGAFMYQYLRKISCSQVVAFAVGVMYVFTIHMGGPRKEHTALLLSALYVPVILYFAEQYLQKRRLGWLFGCAAAMALQFLGGFLQYVIYFDLAAFFYLLTAGISRKIPWKQMLKHGFLWIISYFGMIMGAVLGTAQFMLFLADSAGQKMDYAAFTSYSLHPVKILMSIFPEIFGSNVWEAFRDKNYASGVDVEILLGAAAISLLLASCFLLKKSFYVRYMTGLLLGSFFYACMANIEILGKVIYRIPILNMFRVPSRTLFLFTFAALVLVACSLDALLKNADYYKRVNIANLWVASGMILIALLYQSGLIVCEGERQPVGEVLGIPFLLFIIYLVVFYGGRLLQRKHIGEKVKWAVPIAVMLLMIVQVMPYYRVAYVSAVDGHQAIPEEVVQQTGTQKVWTPDGSCGELVSNSAQTYGIQGMNAYTNFNLGNFYKYCMSATTAPMNSSGLYNGFGNAVSILGEKIDLLSMLGIKYLMLSPDQDAQQIVEIEAVNEGETLIDAADVSWIAAPDYQISAWPISLMSDQYYQITFTAKAEVAGESFYIDFAATGYDNPEQEQWFVTVNEETEYTAILPSGDCSQAADIYFRIVALTQNQLDISEVCVKRVEVEATQLYQFVSAEEGYNIYENPSAKELIYAPKQLTSMTSEELNQLYTQTAQFDLLETSYLTDYDGQHDFSQVAVEIDDIKLSNNTATAQVVAEGDCFVNFSQTYYPGWKAYVDGNETEVYEVNGLIQGIFVPTGEHTIQFSFEPLAFYLGSVISFLTIASWIVYIIYSKELRSSRKVHEVKKAW